MCEIMKKDETRLIEELYKYSNNDNQEVVQKLLEPFTHLLKISGSGMRSKLATAFNYWLQVPNDKLQEISDVICLLHTASLLIDDIQDESVIRRGFPASHIVFGISRTVNAALHASFIITNKVAHLGNQEVIKIFVEEGSLFSNRQLADIYWRNKSLCPSEEQYNIMAAKKTGSVIKLMIKSMQCFSKCDKNFEELLDILGVYYQVRDDYCNLFDSNYQAKKGFCEDLTEGKYSFPIIHDIRIHPDDTRITDILKQRPTDKETKHKCVGLLKEFGSFEYTKHILENLDERARSEIKRLGGNPYLEKVLDTWNEVIINNDSNEATKANISSITSEHSS